MRTPGKAGFLSYKLLIKLVPELIVIQKFHTITKTLLCCVKRTVRLFLSDLQFKKFHPRFTTEPMKHLTGQRAENSVYTSL